MITINGKQYKVVGEHTQESHNAEGRDLVAQEMRKNGISAQVYLTTPNGTVLFLAHRYINGEYSTVTKLG